MKINSIILLNEKNEIIYEIQLKQKSGVLYGFSGKGKTLLFNLVKYCLASYDDIDSVEIKNVFKGVTRVSLELIHNNKKVIVCRELSRSFCGFINDETIEDKALYRTKLEEILNFKKVMVLKNKSYGTITYRLKDFVDFLFFSEEKIGDNKKLCSLGKIDILPEIKNLFDYIVTGLSIEENSLKQAKKIEKLEKEQLKAINCIQKSIKKPTEAQIIKYNATLRRIEEIDNTNLQLKDEVNEKEQLLITQKTELIKLKSLSDFYYSKIEDLDLSHTFSHIFSNLEIKCENCNKTIKLINPLEINDEMSYYSEELSKIKKVILFSEKKIKELESDISIIKEKIKLNNEEKEELHKYQFSFKERVETYNNFLKITEQITIKTDDDKREDVNLKEKEIEYNFEDDINNICKNVTNRLKKWGLKKYVDVTFDYEDYDFKFSGTSRRYIAKGYKTIGTSALCIELIKNCQKKNINYFNFILLDSFWTTIFPEEIQKKELITNILTDLNDEKIQIIIFENDVSGTYSNLEIIKI